MRFLAIIIAVLIGVPAYGTDYGKHSKNGYRVFEKNVEYNDADYFLGTQGYYDVGQQLEVQKLEEDVEVLSKNLLEIFDARDKEIGELQKSIARLEGMVETLVRQQGNNNGSSANNPNPVNPPGNNNNSGQNPKDGSGGVNGSDNDDDIPWHPPTFEPPVDDDYNGNSNTNGDKMDTPSGASDPNFPPDPSLPEDEGSDDEFTPSALDVEAYKLFVNNCASCHGAKEQKGGLQLVDEVNRELKFTDLPERVSIVGRTWNIGDLGQQMPPGKPLSDGDLNTLFKWMTEASQLRAQ